MKKIIVFTIFSLLILTIGAFTVLSNTNGNSEVLGISKSTSMEGVFTNSLPVYAIVVVPTVVVNPPPTLVVPVIAVTGGKNILDAMSMSDLD